MLTKVKKMLKIQCLTLDYIFNLDTYMEIKACRVLVGISGNIVAVINSIFLKERFHGMNEKYSAMKKCKQCRSSHLCIKIHPALLFKPRYVKSN